MSVFGSDILDVVKLGTHRKGLNEYFQRQTFDSVRRLSTPSLSAVVAMRYQCPYVHQSCRLVSKQAKIIVRDALHADYEAVMAIDKNVYRGRDYLPWVYDQHLVAPSVKAVVGQSVDGGIVAYAAGRLEENERMLVMIAGRVKQSHQGQGLSRQMLDAIRNRFLSEGKAIDYEVLLAKEKEMANGNGNLWKGFNELFQRRIIAFDLKIKQEVTPTNIKEQQNRHFISISNEQIPVSKPSDIVTSLGNALCSEWLERMCQENILVANWLPYIMPSRNVKFFLRSNDVLLASTPGSSDMLVYLNDEQIACKLFNSESDHEKNQKCNTLYQNSNKNNCVTKNSYTGISKDSDHHSREIRGNKKCVCPRQRNMYPYNIHSKSGQDKYEDKEKYNVPILGQFNTTGVNYSDNNGMLSVVNSFPCRLGLATNLDLYFDSGNIPLSTAVLARHIENQLTFATSRGFDKIHLKIFVHDSDDHEHAVTETMENLYNAHPVCDSMKRMRLYRCKI